MCKEYVNIQTGKVLDLDKVTTLLDNAMLKVKPELWCEWDFEKNDELEFDIWKMTKGMAKKTWWICEKCKSSFGSNVASRIKGSACPYCAGQKVNHTNSLASLNPNISKKWHPTKNKDLTPDYVTCGSGQKVWWLGECGHDWEAPIESVVKGKSKCPYCSGKIVNNDNSLASLYPEISSQWHTNLNGKLTPSDVKSGSGKKVWWLCPKCNSSYDMTIGNKVCLNQSCPYCVGKRVNHTNSLSSLNHELASQWHPTKNGKLTPNDVTCKSNKKVWWLGTCGHEWEESVTNRSKNRNCPICSNHKVLKGFNDMWTTDIKKARWLLNPEDGYKYTKNSNQKVDWKCINCGEIMKSKVISSISSECLPCPNCSDGKSYPEKFMYHLLKQLNVEFEWEKTFKWSKGKRYDFYIPTYNMIIETHGGQHSEETGFVHLGGRSLKEEQENDKLKFEMAINNKISRYIAIDCRNSEMKWIKNSIVNSELNYLFDMNNIDWHKIELNSNKSLIMEVAEIYNSGIKSTIKIGEILKFSSNTVRMYLKKASKVGLCDYNPKNVNALIGETKRKSIVQLSCDLDYINTYEYSSEIDEKCGYSGKAVSAVCRGEYKTAFGYKWMYKEDYDKYMEEQNKLS